MNTSATYKLLKPTKIFFAVLFVFLMVRVGSVSATEKVNPTNYSEAFLPTVSTIPVANPVLSEPVFFGTAPVLACTTPVFARIAPIFVKTAPVFARIAPFLACTAPVFIIIAPVLHGITPRRIRTVLVQTGLVPVRTHLAPVFTKTVFMLTETDSFRARISQMPTRASPGITVIPLQAV